MANPITTISAHDLASRSYLEYATYVNRGRQIPHAGDGLMPVQRRILLAASKYNKLTLTNSIVSDTTRDWHPHGTASVEPVVSALVRHSVLNGHGNHGKRLMRVVSASAPRYTKSGASKEVNEVLFKLKDYAPHFMNEVDNMEPEFFVTPVPLALVYGHSGIGVGVVTRIPAFTYESLVAAYRNDNPAYLKPQYGYKMTGGELSDIWHTGSGRLELEMRVSYEWSEDDGCYVSIIEGSGELFQPALGLFDDYIENDRVWIRDESKTQVRIVIGRTKGTRAISDDRIFEIAQNAAKFNRKYDVKCVVGGMVRRVGLRDWLQMTMELYQTNYKKWQDDKTAELRRKLYQQCIAQEVGKHLRDQLDNDEILQLINTQLADDVFNKQFAVVAEVGVEPREADADDIATICKKSMSNLRNADFDSNVARIIGQIKEVLAQTSKAAIDDACRVLKVK